MHPEPEQPPASDPTVVFLHIGKTGGATLRRILPRNLPRTRVLRLRNPSSAPHGFLSTLPIEQFAGMLEAERLRPRLIMGHMVFGIHEFVPRPSTYVTLLRHPVARAVSGYRRALHDPDHRFHATVVAEQMDLETYLASGLALELDNSMVRAIIGDIETPYGHCTAAMLESAKATIEQHFAVVGVAERFDEMLLLLRRRFGWAHLTYVRANVSRKRVPGEAMPPRALDLIREQNRFDLDLYDHVTRRLDSQLGSDSGFLRELDRFRRANGLYRPWGTLTYTLPQRVRGRLAPGAQLRA